ncbi:NUMOD1 domain-containing DNA-binding protein [Parapedobacter tibetensis]|uniref:NUMOD1 domain-containing DNA-binding protein n=1 Tax=Parapedobacter tibetensis TaxID=2972951 RepID=UPI00214D95E8|nr:NUMOD1 domain-containing DNA-binding protein [Parapedobacter tibetensis]
MFKQYPYQNLVLEDMEREEWTDVPGLDGYYLVSSLGRIKRLKREVVYPDGKVITLPEKINVTTLHKAPNEELGDFTLHLRASMQVSNKTYRFSVRRLVYCCFVKEFALDDSSVLIIPKNGNGLDMRPDNLKMIPAIQQRSKTYESGRRSNALKGHYKEKIKSASVAACQKTVSQYGKDGKKISTYPSVREAERLTGISHASIGTSARELVFSAGGFYWRYGKARKIDIKGLLAKRRRDYKSWGTRVTQYDLRGNKVAEYPSMLKAEQETGIRNGSIRMVLLGRYKSAGNYFWKEGVGPAKIDLSNHKAGRALRVKKVNQYTLKGKYVGSFDSIREAARAIQASETAISAACKGILSRCKGYKWRFLGEISG